MNLFLYIEVFLSLLATFYFIGIFLICQKLRTSCLISRDFYVLRGNRQPSCMNNTFGFNNHVVLPFLNSLIHSLLPLFLSKHRLFFQINLLQAFSRQAKNLCKQHLQHKVFHGLQEGHHHGRHQVVLLFRIPHLVGQRL